MATSSRQRVQESINHRQPDQIAVDFGSTPVTGIHCSVVAGLRDFYGLEKRLVKVHEPYQMLGMVEEDLMDAMGIDVVGITPRCTIFGFQNEDWKEFKTPWGQTVLVSKHFVTKTESNGDVLIYPCGDSLVPPSGRMPASSYFFDAIVRQEPVDEDNLKPEDNLQEFGDWSDLEISYFKRELDNVAGKGRAVALNAGGTALGDIALVPAPFLKHPKGIRDIAEWYMTTAGRQDYVHEIFEKQVQIALRNLEILKGIAGDRIDALFLCGTDFGTQISTFCSVNAFKKLWLPYYQKMTGWIHQNTSWKVFKHSCGAVETFIPSFIEAGFDILNPVQCSAHGMDPELLKEKYGRQITFWGGGVDTQKVLPFGTPDEVRKQVAERCRIFGKEGGFIFNAIHNVQARTPVENVVAMIETVKKHS
ncbi:uroporphyrinogen decarboxylase family protein [Oscillatoria amoena NRMC-F 0135]|nr:uroporphyrinogen decarboxylase family protein [Oscillatoria amoena NRMC-F 0135]MDL5053233.1 uroporphyrinogen decarboxylase family protein [Oscillatoria laete-virens NRMC-F 0139]